MSHPTLSVSDPGHPVADFEDRRLDRRAKVNLLVNRFLDGHPYMCRMTDISRTGARLIPIIEPTRAPRFMGLQFQLPGTDAVVTASGEVVSADREVVSADGARTVGIRFTNLPPDSAWAIEAFLKAS